MEGLTEREVGVLGAMVRSPIAPDRELAESLGINHSTVTAIRHRLVERGIFDRVVIPDVQVLGSRIMFGSIARLPVGAPSDLATGLVTEVDRGWPEVVSTGATPDLGFILGFAPDYAMARMQLLRWERLIYTVGGGPPVSMEHQFFPLSSTRMLEAFDYRRLLALRFRRPVTEADADHPDSRNIRWTRPARAIFTAMVADPNSTIRDLADRTGITRQSAGSLRRRFLETGLLVPRGVPDLRSLGFQVLVLSQTRFHPALSGPARDRALRGLFGATAPGFFMAHDQVQGFSMGSARDRESCMELSSAITSTATRQGDLRAEPRIQSMAMDRLRMVRWHDFAPLVADVFARRSALDRTSDDDLTTFEATPQQIAS